MNRKLIALILTGCLALGMVGCSSSSSSSSDDTDETETTEESTDEAEEEAAEETSSGELGTIGILMPSLSAEFFVTTADSLEATVEAAGYSANVQSFDYDAAAAVTCIENFITEGVVGIAYMTVDTSGDDALAEAMDAGIAVLTCGVENENYDVCQIVDNYETGYMIGQMAADYINENFGGEAQIACITTTSSSNMMDRVDGYKAALEELCPGAEIVYEVDVTTTGDGSTFAENLNTLYPDCKIVVSYSDTFADEVAQVWEALGYDEDAAIFGHDGEEKVLASIAEGGYLKGTIVLGDSGVEMGEGIIAYLNGEYESGELVMLDGTAVTAENIDEYYN